MPVMTACFQIELFVTVILGSDLLAFLSLITKLRYTSAT